MVVAVAVDGGGGGWWWRWAVDMAVAVAVDGGGGGGGWWWWWLGVALLTAIRPALLGEHEKRQTTATPCVHAVCTYVSSHAETMVCGKGRPPMLPIMLRAVALDAPFRYAVAAAASPADAAASCAESNASTAFRMR